MWTADETWVKFVILAEVLSTWAVKKATRKTIRFERDSNPTQVVFATAYYQLIIAITISENKLTLEKNEKKFKRIIWRKAFLLMESVNAI